MPSPTSGGPSGSLARSVMRLGVDAEDLGHDLRVHRLVPLPRRPAKRVRARALPEAPKRISASSFGPPPAPEGSTNTAQPMPRSLPRSRASARRDSKPFQSDFASTLSSSPADRRCRRSTSPVGVLYGNASLRNQVAPAQLDAVDAGLARRLLDQALDEVGDVRPPGAAVGGGRRGVGEHEPVAAVQRRNAVHVDRVDRRWQRVDERPGMRQIRAHVARSTGCGCARNVPSRSSASSPMSVAARPW